MARVRNLHFSFCGSHICRLLFCKVGFLTPISALGSGFPCFEWFAKRLPLTSEQRPLLETLAAGPEPRLRPAAQSALKRLELRLAQAAAPNTRN
jgi:hypothetical protein